MLDINKLNIPSNQQYFLKDLLSKAADNAEAVFAVECIVNIIKCVENFYPNKGQEVLKGAHIIIDSPNFFYMITRHTKTRHRMSSHYRNSKISELGIDIPSNADFLIGVSKINDNQKFWMQLENTKVDWEKGLISGAILAVLHILDYIYYKFSGKNVGPCGLSEYVESNPIKIASIKSLLSKMKFGQKNEFQNTDTRFKLLQSCKDQNITSARSF